MLENAIVGAFVRLGESSGRDVCVESVSTNKKPPGGHLTANIITLKHRIARGMKLAKEKSCGQSGSSEAQSNRQCAQTTGPVRQSEKPNHRSQQALSFPGNECVVDHTARSVEGRRKPARPGPICIAKNDGTFSRSPREILLAGSRA
jgi:hypothetical protein